jgi:UPF0755 protein
LLPETYKFTRGMSREQILGRMEQAQKRVLQEVWARRSSDLPSQVQTPEQLVTLASLVEKETSRDDERTRVAAVFVNRLKAKMRLQSDPTIIYGLTGGKGALGRPIMKSEIEQATPYNTYTIEGLPPGPIANPGRASLEAAANPARTKELYVVADGTGGHVLLVLGIAVREDVATGAVGDEVELFGARRIGSGLERGAAGIGDRARRQSFDCIGVVRRRLLDLALHDRPA